MTYAARQIWLVRVHRTLADLAPPAVPKGAHIPLVSLHNHADCCLTLLPTCLVLLCSLTCDFPHSFTCQTLLNI